MIISASALTDHLREVLGHGSVIAAESVADVLARTKSTLPELLATLLPMAAEKARAPVSGYHVGAVAMGQPADASLTAGTLYLGANLELTGLPLLMTVHAEQSAVNNAWLSGETGIEWLAVSAPPCGFCRQFLAELTTADRLEVLVADSRATSAGIPRFRLSDLLPRRFGPAELGRSGGLMQTGSVVLRGLKLDGSRHPAELAAEQSYAPYSGNYAGFELVTTAGTSVVGRTAESAAFNPSLTAMQSALASLALATPPASPLPVQRATLVEVPTTVSQRAVSELILRAVASSAPLNYHVGQPI